MKIQIIKDKIRSNYYVVSKMDDREIGTIQKASFQGNSSWNVNVQEINKFRYIDFNSHDFEVAKENLLKFMETV